MTSKLTFNERENVVNLKYQRKKEYSTRPKQYKNKIILNKINNLLFARNKHKHKNHRSSTIKPYFHSHWRWFLDPWWTWRTSARVLCVESAPPSPCPSRHYSSAAPSLSVLHPKITWSARGPHRVSPGGCIAWRNAAGCTRARPAAPRASLRWPRNCRQSSLISPSGRTDGHRRTPGIPRRSWCSSTASIAASCCRRDGRVLVDLPGASCVGIRWDSRATCPAGECSSGRGDGKSGRSWCVVRTSKGHPGTDRRCRTCSGTTFCNN